MTNLKGLVRWGYVVLEPDPADPRPAPPRATGWFARRAAALARRRSGGRWPARSRGAGASVSGRAAIAALRAELEAIAGRLELELPHYLPVSGVYRQDPERWRARSGPGEPPASLDLSALLSQVLLAFTIDFERESRLALALSANSLRVIGADGGGGARPAGADRCLEGGERGGARLSRAQLAGARADRPARRAHEDRARSPSRARRAQAKYRALLRSVEASWRERFGAATIERLRASLAGLIDARDGDAPLMAARVSCRRRAAGGGGRPTSCRPGRCSPTRAPRYRITRRSRTAAAFPTAAEGRWGSAWPGAAAGSRAGACPPPRATRPRATSGRSGVRRLPLLEVVGEVEQADLLELGR